MPAQSYQLAEVHDSSNGQFHSAVLSQSLPSVFATGGEKDVNLYSVEAELGGQFKAKRIMQLQGHKQSVTSVAFSHTDSSTDSDQVQVLASGSFSGSVRTWDIEMGRANCQLNGGHTSGISALTFFDPPKYLASGGLDTTIRIWDLRRRGAIAIHKGHADRVTCLKFSPDGNWLVSGGADNYLRLFDMRTRKQLYSWREDNSSNLSGCNFIDFHPGLFLMCANFGKEMKVIEMEDFQIVSTLPQTSNLPRVGMFHPDGDSFISVFEDGFETSVWEPSEKLEHNRAGWNWPVSAVVSEEDKALRVLSLAKSSVHLHTVDLSNVKIKRTTSVTTPNRKIFDRTSKDEEEEIQGMKEELVKRDDDVGAGIQIFGKLPKRPASCQRPYSAQPQNYNPKPFNPPRVDHGLEPGEIRYKPQTPSSRGDTTAVTTDSLLSYISKNSNEICGIMSRRMENFDKLVAQWSTGDMVSTARLAMSLGSQSAIIDLLNMINETTSVWTLELACVVMDAITSVLSDFSSKQAPLKTTVVKSIDVILQSFGNTIKTTVQSMQLGIGNGAVDLQREKREERCKYLRDVMKNKISPYLDQSSNRRLILLIEQIP